MGLEKLLRGLYGSVPQLDMDQQFARVRVVKPMTFDLQQAEDLLKVVEKSGVVFAVSHNYTGHPLVRQAREMVRLVPGTERGDASPHEGAEVGGS